MKRTILTAILGVNIKGRFTRLLLAGAFALQADPSDVCRPLALNAGKNVAGYVTDQYAWFDSQCRARSAALVLFDQKGGHAKQFTYTLPDGTVRVVGESGDLGAGGFGYIVSHLRDPRLATDHGEDDSPLGSSLSQTSRVVFQGKHHAIHEFTLNYPRWARNPATGEVRKYDVPVTIHWMFATGRDHPLWSVTYDLHQAPANAIDADTRAPYGDMNFDGAPAKEWSDEIGGVAWGDNYQFTTAPGNKLTLNSPWNWKGFNGLAPYNYLWTANTDAQMGIVGTQVADRQDAGGSQEFMERGVSSANKTCPEDPAIGLPQGHVMPCSSDWPYQSVNYSFWDANGNGTASQTTPSKRLAWGTDFGYLGQQTMTTSNGNTIHGWPRVSYSTYITLGRNSDQPTIVQAVQALAADAVTLTSGAGTVATSGPAGVGRTDTINYSPAGYNPVYGTFEVANTYGGKVELIFRGSGIPLIDPIIVVRGYYGGAKLKNVRLATLSYAWPLEYGYEDLIEDQDYFASSRDDTHELWLTIHRPLNADAFNSILTITF